VYDGVSIAESTYAPGTIVPPHAHDAALITLVLSFAAMALAVSLGMLIAIGRVYGDPVSRLLLTVYVEVMRGTPVLLQLFVIYYGLPQLGVELDPLPAALIGFSLNMAAYACEILRGALERCRAGSWIGSHSRHSACRPCGWFAPQGTNSRSRH
jgi:His/Glu/Gln/Arg/opine family amino acid ABC transporter permease subunit